MVELERTSWTARSLADGQGGLVPLISGTTISAEFEGGRIAGSAGCNRYTAECTIDGNTLAIGAAASTRMMCWPEEVMAQEGAFLAALAAVQRFRIEGDRLTLETAAGVALVEFDRAPPSPGSGPE